MNNFEVGEQYPGNYKQEGIKLDYNGGFTLFIFLPEITAEEASDIQKGDYKFGLTLKEDILFFISAFGGSIELSDAPFHFGLYNDDRFKELPKVIEDGQGIALNVIAVDSKTGIIKALRLIGISTNFSRELIRICISQSYKKVEYIKYERKFKRIQNAYSSEDLYKESIYKYSGER